MLRSFIMAGTALLAPALVATAFAAVDVQVSAEDGMLYVDARAAGLFEPDLDEALRSGLPARIEVDLVLLEQRAAIFEREVQRASWGVSVVFDLLDERYTVLDAQGTILLQAGELPEVEDFVTRIELWPLCALADVEGGRTHAVDVSFSVEPLTMEEVRDLERWLRGNVRDGGRLRDVPGQLVGVLRNRLGLGGHTESGRSGEFRPAELPAPD